MTSPSGIFCWAKIVRSLKRLLCHVVGAFIYCAHLPCAGSDTNGLLAHYPLETNGEDVMGQSRPFMLTNGDRVLAGATIPAFVIVTRAPFTNGVLFVNGQYAPNGHFTHYFASGPIPGLSYGSFSISVQFYPLPMKRGASSLNQIERKLDRWTSGRYTHWRGFDKNIHNTANILTGGQGYRWFGLSREHNRLQLTLNNQAFVHEFKSAAVAPNRWHHLICSMDLKQRKIYTCLDGRQLETIALPPDFKLEVVGSQDDADDREFTFVNYSNGSVFYGYAAHLKIFGRALSETEIARLYAESDAERPTFPKTPSRWLAVILVSALIAGAVVLSVAVARWRQRPGVAP